MRKANMTLSLCVSSEVWLHALLIVRSRRRGLFIMSRPSLPPGKVHQYPLNGRMGGSQSTFGRCEQQGSLLTLTGADTPFHFLCRPALILVTTQTRLSHKHREDLYFSNKFFAELQWYRNIVIIIIIITIILMPSEEIHNLYSSPNVIRVVK